jgi:DNA-binding NarL/FixJ family response regulator
MWPALLMIGVLIFAVDAKLRRTLEQLPQKDSAIAIVRNADDEPSLVSLAETSNVDVVLAQKMPPAELVAEWQVRHNAPAWVFFLDPVDGRAAADALTAGASAILPSSTDVPEIKREVAFFLEEANIPPSAISRTKLHGSGPWESRDVSNSRL